MLYFAVLFGIIMKRFITIIRVAVGWHFIYEGVIKLFADNWSAASYLNNTYGFFSGFYHWLAASSGRLAVVDFLNVWGLVLIGLALFTGLLARWASLAGALLLTLYYFAYPPFGITVLGSEGSVYIINQQFIEAIVLVFLFYFKEQGYSLDNAVKLLRKKKKHEITPKETTDGVTTRRELLKELVTLPVLGLFGWGASRSAKLYGVDTLSGATIQVNRLALGELKGELPKGKLGKYEISRLIMGGNMIVGYAHSRDLLYVSKLFKAYNTEKKIFETLMLCEQAGINCINSSFVAMPTIVKYRKLTGSKIRIIVQVHVNEKADDIYEYANIATDNGVDIIQLHGAWSDRLVRDNRLDVIVGMVQRIRSNGVVAGICAHTVDSLITCEANGIIPDYFMKTMHHDNYWSAHPRENRKPFEVDGEVFKDHNMFHENCFCPFPERTVEFVNRTRVPVIGFKTLAAGAIHPEDGFKWAFENGADFICVGMFDFQVVENINTCINTLNNLSNRKREWFS